MVDLSRCLWDSHDQLWSKQPPAVADNLVKTVITTPFTGYAIGNTKPVRRKKQERMKTMRKFKKMIALAITMVMVLAMAIPAMAAPGGAIEATTGTITVENAANGETYKIFKIFDATISKVEGEDGVADAVSYTYPSATLPETLAAAFEIETIGGTNYVKVKENTDDEAVLDAVKAYMATLDESLLLTPRMAMAIR